MTPDNGDGADDRPAGSIDGEALEPPYTREGSHGQDGVYTHTAAFENAGGRTESSASLRSDERWSLLSSISAITGRDTQMDTLDPMGTQRVSACDSGVGFGLGAEYRVNYRLGLAFGIHTGQCEVDWEYDTGPYSGHNDADVRTNLIYAGLNFHLTRPDQRVDVWIGPMVGNFDYSSPSMNAIERNGYPFEAMYMPDWKGETVLGANLGMKVPLKPECPLAFYLGATWLDSSMEADARSITGVHGAEAPKITLDRSPIYLNAGIVIDF